MEVPYSIDRHCRAALKVPWLHLSPLWSHSEGPVLHLSPLSSPHAGPRLHLAPLASPGGGPGGLNTAFVPPAPFPLKLLNKLV